MTSCSGKKQRVETAKGRACHSRLPDASDMLQDHIGLPFIPANHFVLWFWRRPETARTVVRYDLKKAPTPSSRSMRSTQSLMPL